MLLEAIEQLQILLRSNKDNKKLLENAVSPTISGQLHVGSRWYTRSLVVFMNPYFKDIHGMRAPANEDEMKKKDLHEQDPYLKVPKMWHAKETNLLRNSVKLNLIKMIMEPLTTRLEILERHAKTDKESFKKLQDLKAQIDSIKKMGVAELQKMANRSADWLMISAVDFQAERSPLSCELMWQNALSKSTVKWTKQEDAQLKAIAKEQNCKDWDTVAERMGGTRTAFQCAERYHHKLTSRIKKGHFSEEEDKNLLTLIALCRKGDEIPWTQVSYHMEGRTRTQLYYRWERALNPDLRRGKWSKEEDMMLIAAVQAHGERWTRIKDFLPGRTANQCRERYVNSFSGNYTFGHWTPDEDAKLLDLVAKHGAGKWAQISREMPSRNDNMILMRYKRLTNKHKGKDLRSVQAQNARRARANFLPPCCRFTSTQRRCAIVHELQSSQVRCLDSFTRKCYINSQLDSCLEEVKQPC
ncbi:snRNA-activating protein complex subunit 4 [Ixodes scapularis]|uniref:snRNA-activating protein complex subunit 4 n=1 Tax=Ixodes scapularis TaxID=6945 RepID=UPI001C387EB4|nr:snRNA-activating protein complex subunit 4 [Ixodes scapularis]